MSNSQQDMVSTKIKFSPSMFYLYSIMMVFAASMGLAIIYLLIKIFR